MNFKKIFLVGLFGGIFSFFLGWLLFGIVFKDAMHYEVEGVMKSDTDMVWWAMILSNLLWGWLFAYIFIRWASISTWLAGLKAGAIIGLLFVAALDFGFLSMTNLFTLNGAIVDILINTVYCGIIGAFVGWLSGKNWF
jgi:hypothetical protein